MGESAPDDQPRQTSDTVFLEGSRIALELIRADRYGHVGVGKGRSVFSCVSHEGHVVVNVIKAYHQSIFVLGAGLSDHPERPLHMPQLCLILDFRLDKFDLADTNGFFAVRAVDISDQIEILLTSKGQGFLVKSVDSDVFGPYHRIFKRAVTDQHQLYACLSDSVGILVLAVLFDTACPYECKEGHGGSFQQFDVLLKGGFNIRSEVGDDGGGHEPPIHGLVGESDLRGQLLGDIFYLPGCFGHHSLAVVEHFLCISKHHVNLIIFLLKGEKNEFYNLVLTDIPDWQIPDHIVENLPATQIAFVQGGILSNNVSLVGLFALFEQKGLCEQLSEIFIKILVDLELSFA